MTRIIQISDLHCGSRYFEEGLMEQTISQVNSSSAEILVITGDLTCEGYPREFETARRYIDRFDVPGKLVVPGNHDARNVGYLLFEEMIGDLFSELSAEDLLICGADSTEPDLDDGQIGRTHTANLAERFSGDQRCKIMAVHHHLVSVPGSGREMNILRDAGDVLKMVATAGVNLVLSGHKHVPHLWQLEGIKILTSATTTTRRVRGPHPPSYNIIDIDTDIDTAGGLLRITRSEVEGDDCILYDGSL